jgi:hypothetical protein
MRNGVHGQAHDMTTESLPRRSNGRGTGGDGGPIRLCRARSDAEARTR